MAHLNSICFFQRKLDDIDAKFIAKDWLKEATQPEEEKRFVVILHNDPINGVDYVTKVINSVFGYGFMKSMWLMLKAHFTGKSVLWQGPKHKAEKKRDKMIAHGPDPYMVHRGAKPLTVTVEQVD